MSTSPARVQILLTPSPLTSQFKGLMNVAVSDGWSLTSSLKAQSCKSNCLQASGQENKNGNFSLWTLRARSFRSLLGRKQKHLNCKFKLWAGADRTSLFWAEFSNNYLALSYECLVGGQKEMLLPPFLSNLSPEKASFGPKRPASNTKTRGTHMLRM